MLRRILLTVVIMSIWLQIDAREVVVKPDFRSIDSATFADYTNENWLRIISIGKYALKNDIDYFYLRMRMGIAEFNLMNYPGASGHFEKALEFNSGDRTAQIYLYDTYLILGKQSRALKLGSKFNNGTRKVLNYKPKLISNINIYTGYSFSNNYKLNDRYNLNSSNDTIAGLEILIGDKSIISVGSGFQLTPAISYYLGYSYLEIQKKTTFQYEEGQLVLDSVQSLSWGYQNYYSFNLNFYRESYDFKIKQNELYQNIKLQFNKGWATYLYGNLLFINTANTKINSTLVTESEIAYQIDGENPVYFDYQYYDTELSTSDSSLFNYIVGLNIEKDFNNLKFNFNANYSELNAATQYQFGLSAFYYLNKKATIYGSTGYIWFNQEWDRRSDESRNIFDQKLGGRIFNDLWCEAEFVYGDLNNVNVYKGSVVYNNVDKMNFKSGISLKYRLGLHFELNLLYQYNSYESMFIEFNNNAERTIYNNNYQTQNIIGGMVWKP